MANGVIGNQVVINGNFVGQGGSVALETTLGGDGSPTDQLVINGNASGTTRLFVSNRGGLGALTTNGIEVVAISGVSTSNSTSAISLLSLTSMRSICRPKPARSR